MSERPFIEKSICDGNYENVDHYIEIMFRLLREDCLQPFRNNFNRYREYLNIPNESFRQWPIKGLRVFKNVKICDNLDDAINSIASYERDNIYRVIQISMLDQMQRRESYKMTRY